MKNILVTGAAGFIGYHLIKKLSKKFFIFGIDNLNSYYDRELKLNRLKELKKLKNFKFFKSDFSNKTNLNIIFENRINYVIHLAAQAGVRYAMKNPMTYIDNNIKKYHIFLNYIKDLNLEHAIFASSSSVYGQYKNVASEKNNSNYPLGLYASSKKFNEIYGYSFAKYYSLPLTFLRFFSVIGPYGRPDMAYYKFAKKIMNNTKIDLYNYGNNYRDFTDVSIVVNYISLLLKKPPSKKDNYYQVFNVSNGQSIKTLKLVEYLEKFLKKKAKVNLLKKQIGESTITLGDSKKIKKFVGVKYKVSFSKSIKLFIKWFKTFYKNNHISQ